MIEVRGHFGEWLQGRLGPGGPLALVTVACPALAVRPIPPEGSAAPDFVEVGGLFFTSAVRGIDLATAKVVEAIRAWAGDYADDVSEPLMDSYTSDEAFADTYVGWSGSSAPDPDVNGTYLRIDGPEVWIELVCQNGVVIQGETHYHTIYRDKARDYGGSL